MSREKECTSSCTFLYLLDSHSFFPAAFYGEVQTVTTWHAQHWEDNEADHQNDPHILPFNVFHLRTPIKCCLRHCLVIASPLLGVLNNVLSSLHIFLSRSLLLGYEGSTIKMCAYWGGFLLTKFSFINLKRLLRPCSKKPLFMDGLKNHAQSWVVYNLGGVRRSNIPDQISLCKRNLPLTDRLQFYHKYTFVACNLLFGTRNLVGLP